MLAAFDEVDVLVTPTVACPPPVIGSGVAEIDGRTLPAGAILGRFTQPISFAGLPALTVPVFGDGPLPAGVQLVGRPGADALLIAVAARLEALGAAGLP